MFELILREKYTSRLYLTKSGCKTNLLIAQGDALGYELLPRRGALGQLRYHCSTITVVLTDFFYERSFLILNFKY